MVYLLWHLGTGAAINYVKVRGP